MTEFMVTDLFDPESVDVRRLSRKLNGVSSIGFYLEWIDPNTNVQKSCSIWASEKDFKETENAKEAS